MFEQTENDNIHGLRILIKASLNSAWFNEAVSDIVGTFTSSLAIFALKRYSANRLDLDYASHQRAYTNIAGLWFLKTLVTTVSYNFGTSLYSCVNGVGSKAFYNITNIKNNIELFGIFGGLEIAEVKSIDPSTLSFFSKGYLKARLAVSSLKALGIVVGEALGSLDIKKLLNVPYAIPRAFVGNFFADMNTRFVSSFGLNNIGPHIGEFKFELTENINSVSRELSQAGFDAVMQQPVVTGVKNMSNSTINKSNLNNNLNSCKCSLVPLALSKFLQELDDMFGDNVELKISALQTEMSEFHNLDSARNELQLGINELKKELLFRKREYSCDDVINENKNSSKKFINM